MDSLQYITSKFIVDLSSKSPHKIQKINRTIMAQTLNELGFRTGAEVGVAQGNHAKVLCEQNPKLNLYCIDVWDSYGGYPEYKNRIRRYYQEAVEKLKPYNAIFVKKFSLEAIKDFVDESLDFVYLDAAHDFKNIANDICEWTKKVRIGGIVFGHDYENSIDTGDKYQRDVKDVVDAYTHSHGIFPLFELTNDLDDVNFRNDRPGWMFVRQEKDRL